MNENLSNFWAMQYKRAIDSASNDTIIRQYFWPEWFISMLEEVGYKVI